MKIVSCVARLTFTGADGSPRGYGAGYVADVLRGSRAAKITERGHHQLSTFGLLAEMAREDIVSMISQLVDANMLARSGTEFPTVITGHAARALLKGEMSAALLRQKTTETWATGSGYTSDGAQARPLAREEHALFDVLRTLRRAIAAEMAVPPFIVFSDAVLEDLCRVRPGTVAAFGGIRGVGQRKQADFGERFVHAIVEHCRGAGIALDIATPPPPVFAYSAQTRSVKSLPAGDPNRPLHSLPDSVRTAFDMFERGASVEDVASQTRRAVSTVGGYLAEFIQRYRPETVRAWVDDATYRLITETSDGIPLTDENSTQFGLRIGAIHQALVARQTDERALATYEQIRVVVTHRAAKQLAHTAREK
jgi:ATP-dependent DNA helicase RecQ